MKPKLVMCNIFPEPERVKAFASENGFDGIDWSFDLNRLPETPLQESRWAKEQAGLAPFEVRYHCPFYQIDLGHDDPPLAAKADAVFRRIIRLVSKVGGRYLTIHIGLGHDSTEPLSWKTTLDNLRGLVQFGAGHRVTVCLENLAWGWTSKPNLFEKLIRLSGAGVTLDVGHAHACESVASQQYAIQDFVTPHPNKVHNAHIYHTEIPGQGHVPPKTGEELSGRLCLLQEIGCDWWVIEIREENHLLQTKGIIDAWLSERDVCGPATETGASTILSL